MKTKIYQALTTYEIPGGEGSTALPISFINVVAMSANDEAISEIAGDCSIRLKPSSQ